MCIQTLRFLNIISITTLHRYKPTRNLPTSSQIVNHVVSLQTTEYMEYWHAMLIALENRNKHAILNSQYSPLSTTLHYSPLHSPLHSSLQSSSLRTLNTPLSNLHSQLSTTLHNSPLHSTPHSTLNSPLLSTTPHSQLSALHSQLSAQLHSTPLSNLHSPLPTLNSPLLLTQLSTLRYTSLRP